MPKPGERWVMVTSAFHMPRSVGLFRKAGFAVEAYPVDWKVGKGSDLFKFSTLSPATDWPASIPRVREWMGLIAYRLAGSTDALLPGPRNKRCRNGRSNRARIDVNSAHRPTDREYTPCNSNRRRNNSIWPPW